ncbi:hypothetical protein EVAR_93714_1 [Eumeta japonica]|uniref:Uncharacterized protein n=1 Tax=Eumeta variegata TaxID=151549 RepID=A0A4C1U2W8_EUMVA|nr:hypothetical protein EVAR_93714_1 [Eumeta japonica]
MSDFQDLMMDPESSILLFSRQDKEEKQHATILASTPIKVEKIEEAKALKAREKEWEKKKPQQLPNIVFVMLSSKEEVNTDKLEKQTFIGAVFQLTIVTTATEYFPSSFYAPRPGGVDGALGRAAAATPPPPAAGALAGGAVGGGISQIGPLADQKSYGQRARCNRSRPTAVGAGPSSIFFRSSSYRGHAHKNVVHVHWTKNILSLPSPFSTMSATPQFCTSNNGEFSLGVGSTLGAREESRSQGSVRTSSDSITTVKQTPNPTAAHDPA